jgi:hypothetical protein
VSYDDQEDLEENGNNLQVQKLLLIPESAGSFQHQASLGAPSQARLFS